MKLERKKYLARLVYRAMTDPSYADYEGQRVMETAWKMVEIQRKKFNLIKKNG